MAVSITAKRQLVARMRSELQRARDLFENLIVNGMTRSVGGQPTVLRQTDRRDAAQFIFFEAAVKFESFMRDAFQLEVRARFDVQPQRAVFVMGSSDRALHGVMGWAAPQVLKKRAENLFGKTGFFARLDSLLDGAAYQRLIYAHKVRNRIAHAGGSAVSDYRAILSNLRVPAASRKGLSPGRLLIEYPSSVAQSDRWFHRFLLAYESCAATFNRSFRV